MFQSPQKEGVIRNMHNLQKGNSVVKNNNSQSMIIQKSRTNGQNDIPICLDDLILN